MSRQRDAPPLEIRVCRAIRLLAEGWSVEDTAQAARVRPATVAAWQTADEFQALVDCLSEARQMRDTLDTLAELTPGAIAALSRALAGDDVRIAVQAAREVLDRVGLVRRKEIGSEQSQVIRVEYVNPDGQAVSTSPWSDRHPASPGEVQSGGVWPPLWEDGDGQDPADREGTDG